MDTATAGPSNRSPVETRKERRDKRKGTETPKSTGGSTTPNEKCPDSKRSKSKGKGKATDVASQETAAKSNGKENGAAANPNEIAGGVDFIGFGPASDSESEEDEAEPEPQWPPERSAGKDKRKYEDLGDGYANKKQRVDASSRKAPWLQGVDWESCRNVAELLHNEVEAFVNYISPTLVEDEIRGLMVALITKAVVVAFPDAKVLPFGSFATKLYLPLGDIDLVVTSASMAYSDKVTVLRALANAIKRAHITNNVSIIAKAKVPIIKFVTTHGRFAVDISINQGNGIVAGQMVNGFLTGMQGSGGDGMALRSLVMITKAFLSQRSMNEVFSGGLGSYAIVCLAVSFLQMHPKIRRGEIDPERNLGVLVMEFFELYGCYFNYEEVGISVRDGGMYFSKKQRGWGDPYKRNQLSVEDPLDTSNDISRGSFGFPKVRATFAGAFGILTAATYVRAGILSARREGRDVNLRGAGHTPEDMSILSSVMGVTQETINNRKLVQELYDNRTLHRLLGVNPRTTSIAAATTSTANVETLKTNGSAVRQAWETADTEEDEEEDSYDENDDDRYRAPTPPPASANEKNLKKSKSTRRSKKKRARVSEEQREEEEEGGGRYGIGIGDKGTSRKRRNLGLVHPNTVFTTTSDEEGGGDGSSLEDGEEIEVDDFDDLVSGGGGGGRKSRSDPQDVESKRSYWLSKGIGLGKDDYSD